MCQLDDIRSFMFRTSLKVEEQTGHGQSDEGYRTVPVHDERIAGTRHVVVGGGNVHAFATLVWEWLSVQDDSDATVLHAR